MDHLGPVCRFGPVCSETASQGGPIEIAEDNQDRATKGESLLVIRNIYQRWSLMVHPLLPHTDSNYVIKPKRLFYSVCSIPLPRVACCIIT